MLSVVKFTPSIQHLLEYTAEDKQKGTDKIIDEMIGCYFRAVDGYEYLSSSLNILITEIVEHPTLTLFDPRLVISI